MDSTLWERQYGETDSAWRAFQDYRGMSSGRDIDALYAHYIEKAKNHDPATGSIKSVPTTKINTLYTWSSRHNWGDRVKAWDEHQDKQIQVEQTEAERRAQKAQLEEFRRVHEALGRGQIQMVSDSISLFNAWIKTIKDPSKLEPSEAIGMMRAVASVAESGSNTWAKAIGVKRLLDNMAEEEANVQNEV